MNLKIFLGSTGRIGNLSNSFFFTNNETYVEQGAGMTSTFQTYHESPGGKPFEIEHIWADNGSSKPKNMKTPATSPIGEQYRRALAPPKYGTNQSYSDKPYKGKTATTAKESPSAVIGCATYENNPNFTKWFAFRRLPFRPHNDFKKADIELRQALYQKILQDIWQFPVA